MNERKKILLGSIGAAVAILGVLGWLCWNDWQEMGKVEDEAKGLTSKISKAEADIATMAAVEKRVLVLRNRLKSQVAILPDDEKINGFVDKLTEFANSAGVSIVSLDDSSAKRLQRSRKKAKEAFERVTFRVSLRANVDKFLRFLDLFENKYERFVRIPEFKIQKENSMRVNDTLAEELPLSISLSLETYVYNPKAKGYQQVPIRQEAAKLERLRREGELETSSEELEVARFDFTAKPFRRDPFLDPRIPIAGSDKISAEAKQAQLDSLEELKGRLAEINEAIAKEATVTNSVQLFQLQKANNVKITSLGEAVLKHSKDKFFTVKAYAEEFHVDVEVPYNHLRESRQLAPIGVSLGDVRQTVAQMEKALKLGKFDDVIAYHGQLAEMQKVSTSDDAMVRAFQRADTLKARAEAHKEFATKDIVLGGSICYGKDPSKAVAIINERSYGPGEMVEDGLVVDTITPTTVTFNFKGVKVVRRVGEEGGQ